MKIESVRIQNFRGFRDETVVLTDYTCLVGQNGSGKSTLLNALNVFFRQFKDTATDLTRLTAADFHHKNTKNPIRITVTFCSLSEAAKEDLADYVRQGKLTATAEAVFDAESGRAEIRQYGGRRGLDDFRKYFDADKAGEKAAELKKIFAELRQKYPGIEPASTKPQMEAALYNYEEAHPDECVLIDSEDQFYGVSRGVNRLAPHIQWVFIPAAKDYAEEAAEARGSALSQLLARTVRLKTDFSGKVAELRGELLRSYEAMLAEHEHVLDDLSSSLEDRLRSFAHPAVSAKITWERESADSAVKISDPTAAIRLGERGFSGELSRFGHGLQRSFLLALLQELATLQDKTEPTLVMGIEEPEIYQHPSQARHLSEVLHSLAAEGSQVVCCTHNPLFIPGADAESIRLIRDEGDPSHSTVKAVHYDALAKRLNEAGEQLLRQGGMLAKLYSSLNPVVNEMFFCSRLILVEGPEDVAHLLSYLHLDGRLGEFRRMGCHLVPVGGKFQMARPIAVALELGIPTFVVWDADTNKSKEDEIFQHKRENAVIQRLLGAEQVNDWPKEHLRATGRGAGLLGEASSGRKDVGVDLLADLKRCRPPRGGRTLESISWPGFGLLVPPFPAVGTGRGEFGGRGASIFRS